MTFYYWIGLIVAFVVGYLVATYQHMAHEANEVNIPEEGDAP